MEKAKENHISRKNVENMFDSIAPSYDKLNHILSLGIDVSWRRRVSKMVRNLAAHDCVADFATGTGDLAIDLARRAGVRKIHALDFSRQMLSVAQAKVARRSAKRTGRVVGKDKVVRTLSEIISFSQEDCQNTTLEAESVDVVTIGFGIRNFQSPQRGLLEMLRILKPGGSAVILEFSTPKRGLLAWFVKWYYFKVMPRLGKLFSGNKGAYAYLPATIYEFPNGEDFCQMMREAGFVNVGYKSLTFNMVNLYFGEKK